MWSMVAVTIAAASLVLSALALQSSGTGPDFSAHGIWLMKLLTGHNL
jgi:hypothetical protein